MHCASEETLTKVQFGRWPCKAVFGRSEVVFGNYGAVVRGIFSPPAIKFLLPAKNQPDSPISRVTTICQRIKKTATTHQ